MRVYEFGNFRLDVDGKTLSQDGRPVALTPKAFDTLVLLVENHGRLLEKEAMIARLWPGIYVDEANLANNISLLRKVLGESGSAIQTVPRRGYRFGGDVKVIGGEPEPAPPSPPPPARRWPLAAGLIAVLAAAAVGLLIGRARWRREPPSYTQITFRRGIVTGARLDPDGENLVYSAIYEGRPAEVFTARVDQRTSRPFGLGAHLLSISKHGELVVLTKPEMMFLYPRGTLARVPLTGGAPREIAADVADADWSPDGQTLAVVRWMGNVERVEWPMNRVIYKAEAPAWVSHVRIAPDGKRIAVLLHESERFDDRGRVVYFDAGGRMLASSRVFTSASGIAWAGDDDVWLSASPDGFNNGIYAVDAKGRDRVLARVPGRLALFDVAADGTAILGQEQGRSGIMIKPPGETNERELSWLDGSWLRDLSDDGRTMLFDEESTGGGATARVYLRTADGAPAVDLGEGNALALSPDGKWALARQRFTKPPRLVRIPTGAGQAIAINTGKVEATERVSWLPDSRRILFAGSEPGRPQRAFVLDVAGGGARAVTPEGWSGFVPTPDGAYVLGRKRGSGAMLFPLAGGAPRPVAGLQPEDIRPHFGRDGLVVVHGDAIVHIAPDGARRTLATFGAGRPSGCIYTAPPVVTPDGRGYAYTFLTAESDLFAVRGLR